MPAFLFTARQIRINGTVPQTDLDDPSMRNNKGQPCLVVMKDGNATNFTVGRYTGLEAYIGQNGIESKELAFYNFYHRTETFSANGDSGSLIFDMFGRMVGLLHSGEYRGGTASTHVTYATPAWWLVERIKSKYPHADFNRTTW